MGKTGVGFAPIHYSIMRYPESTFKRDKNIDERLRTIMAPSLRINQEYYSDKKNKKLVHNLE